MRILIINGPNLNMLGKREPEVYGSKTLGEINAEIDEKCEKTDVFCEFFQSNCEGEIVDKIHTVFDDFDGCIINAGAYTHYSYAIRDAIACVPKPFIEVHLSDILKREDFRKISVIREVCADMVSGLGEKSYHVALDKLAELIK